MKVKFVNIKTSARVVNGQIDMLTLRIPFGMLPINTRFRYGCEQDDFTCIKLDKQTFKFVDFEYFDGSSTKSTKFKEKANKIVLVDFLSYSLNKKTNTFKDNGVFKQLL